MNSFLLNLPSKENSLLQYGINELTNLNIGAVYKLLEVLQSHNIMVNVSPDLHQPMEAVRRHAMWADTSAAIQTTNVLLILLCILVKRTSHEELLSVKSLQPSWLPNSLRNIREFRLKTGLLSKSKTNTSGVERLINREKPTMFRPK